MKKSSHLFFILILIGVLSVPLFSYAAWDGNRYDPNETLDPECSYTSTDCTVSLGFTVSGGTVSFTQGSTTALTVSGTATATDLVASNSLTLGSITGFLKATAGAVATALVNLASDVTGILSISNGGTGTSTAPTYGQVLLGNSGGGYDLVATSSLGLLSSAITAFGPSGQTQTGATILLATSTSGSDFTISGSGNTLSFNIPNAGASARGFVSTGAQTFAGTKTFSGNVLTQGGTTFGNDSSDSVTFNASTLTFNSATGIQLTDSQEQSLTVGSLMTFDTLNDQVSLSGSHALIIYGDYSATANAKQFTVARNSNTDQRVSLGFHDNGYGSLQAISSVNNNTGTTLVLNPVGGNVGIGGDTSPDALLSVGSNSEFQVNSSGAIAASAGITSSGAINFASANSVSFPGSGIWNSSGSVGIGTASNWNVDSTPKLFIQGSASGGAVYVDIKNNTSTALNNEVRMRFHNYSSLTDNNASYISSIVGNAGTGASDLAFGVWGGGIIGTNERMRITSTGNVGIGTTTPSSKLTVTADGTYNGTAQVVINGTTNPSKQLLLGFDTSSDFGFIQPVTQGVAYRNLILNPSGGNVGIGTTTPSYPLYTTGSVANTGIGSTAVFENRLTSSGYVNAFTGLTPNVTAGGHAAFGVGKAASSNNLASLGFKYAGDGSTSNAFDISFYGGSSLVTILASGNVGVGTTTPWRTLSVAGTVGFDGLTGSTGAGSLCLDANKQVVYNSGSDSCLSSLRSTKHAITLLDTDALVQIIALEPVSFIYNNDTSDTVRYGFIAEDAATVDPHFATYNADGYISGVDDRSLLATLVKALKGIVGRVVGLEKAVANFAKSFVTDEVQTKRLCVGSACVTETEFLDLLQKNQAATPVQSVSSSPDQNSDANPDSVAQETDSELNEIEEEKPAPVVEEEKVEEPAEEAIVEPTPVEPEPAPVEALVQPE